MIRTTLAVAALIGGVAISASPAYAGASSRANEKFTILTVGAGPGTVVAIGPISGVGTSVDNRRLLPPGTPFQGTFSFPQGDVFTTVSPAGPPMVNFNPTTCVTTIIAPDTFVITGGTMAYAEASGTGVATAYVTLVGGRSADGSCLGPDSRPIFQLTVTRATATVSLGSR